MKLRYETGIATFIQFVVLSFMNILTALVSIVSGCHSSFSDCVVNSFTTVIYFLLLVVWFGLVWLLGIFAQATRSVRLAQLLIGAEVLIAMVAYFNARHHVDAIGLITSVIDLFMAIWVIIIAVGLVRAGGRRVVKKPRNPTPRGPIIDL